MRPGVREPEPGRRGVEKLLRPGARVRPGEGGAESGSALCAGLAALGSDTTVSPRWLRHTQLVLAVGLGGGQLPRDQAGRLQSAPAGREPGAGALSGVGRARRTGPTAGSGRALPLFELSGFDGEARPPAKTSPVSA